MVHGSGSVAFDDLDVVSEAGSQKMSPHAHGEEKPVLRPKIVSGEDNIDLPVRCLQDSLQIGRVKAPDAGKDGFRHRLANGHIKEDVLHPSQVHCRFQLSGPVEPVSHEDYDAAPMENLVALTLDIVVVEPVGGRPMGIAFHVSNPLGFGERGGLQLTVGFSAAR